MYSSSRPSNEERLKGISSWDIASGRFLKNSQDRRAPRKRQPQPEGRFQIEDEFQERVDRGRRHAMGAFGESEDFFLVHVRKIRAFQPAQLEQRAEEEHEIRGAQ